MTKKLIGTAITNANGEATLQYTGQGLGNTNITAESGSVESNSLNILDCIKYDINNSINTSSYSMNATASNSNDVLTTVNDYKVFATSANASGHQLFLPFSVDSNFVIELEAKTESSSNIGLWDVSDNVGKYISATNADWNYFKIRKEGNNVIIQQSSNGQSWNNKAVQSYGTLNLTKTQYRLILTITNNKLYFKNIKIYPV